MSQLLTALTYHKIQEQSELGFNVVAPDRFREHLAILHKMGCEIVTEKYASHNGVMLTFDDSYENIFTQAYPVMAETGAPGILFVITDYIGKDNSWDVRFGLNRTRHMDADQLRELNAAGWRIASHGVHHRSYTGLTPEEIRTDMNSSRKHLEDLTGTAVTGFTPPFNSFLPNLVDLAIESGYTEIFLQQPITIRPFAGNQHVIWRRMVYGFDRQSNIRVKVSGKSGYELVKENIIHFCANATIAVNAARHWFK